VCRRFESVLRYHLKTPISSALLTYLAGSQPAFFHVALSPKFSFRFRISPCLPAAPRDIFRDMAHSDDDMVRRFSSIALRRGDDVLVGASGRKTLIETSSEEAQLRRIMIREYCEQELTAHSSRIQKQAVTSAMAHFGLKERAIKAALYEKPISTTASSSAVK
jgi:hypothetical protein